MISNTQRKLISSLHQKKYRVKNQLFLIEGDKIVLDALKLSHLNDSNTLLLCAREEWILENNRALDPLRKKVCSSDTAELKQISSLVSPPDVIAVLRIPVVELNKEDLRSDYTLVLDSIRDPGNLGTIVRTADWFGIKNIICSPDSVDLFNPKVVQASMGAVLRVKVHYEALEEVFEQAARLKIPVYGTTMDGDDFLDTPVKNPGMIVFGNESSGISENLEKYFRNKIRIPDFQNKPGTESLNVGVSVAIVCSELRRRDR